MTPTTQCAIKVAVSALIIVALAEIAKRSAGFAALIASLPLTSALAFIWLRVDGSAPARIGQLATGISWLTIPSFALFVALAFLLKRGIAFWPSLLAAAALTVICYFAMLPLARRFGVTL